MQTLWENGDGYLCLIYRMFSILAKKKNIDRKGEIDYTDRLRLFKLKLQINNALYILCQSKHTLWT